MKSSRVRRLRSNVVLLVVGILSVTLLSGCGSTRLLHDYGLSVSWAADGTVYFTAHPTAYEALEDVAMPYRLSPNDDVVELDLEVLGGCWVADTVQAMDSGRIILAGGCGFKPEYRVVTYDLDSQSVERVAEWRIEGWKDLEIWTAWSADTTRSFKASGWVSYTKNECSSIARFDHYRFEPLAGLADRFDVRRNNKLDYQEIECWRGFKAGPIVVSEAGEVAILAEVDGEPILFIHDPATEELSELPLAAEATGLSFCGSDGAIAVATHGDEPAIVLIDPISGDSQTIVDGAFDQISCSPDGKTIAVVDATRPYQVRVVEGQVQLWQHLHQYAIEGALVMVGRGMLGEWCV